jgi:flagellar biosynthesis protein FlhG
MTMIDQATELRQLVRRDVGPTDHAREGASPRLIAVTSGKGGVGTSTIALNLAVALSMSGRRVALVDVDLNAGATDVAAWADLEREDGAPPMIHFGPAGLQLLTADWLAPGRPEAPIAGRLQTALRELDGTDAVVLDVRSGVQRMIRELWQQADAWLLVSSTDPLALIDTYRVIKLLNDGGVTAPLYSMINLAVDSRSAAEAQRRLATTCRRFLALDPHEVGYVPHDAAIAAAGRDDRAFVLEARASEASARLAWLAELIAVSPKNSLNPPAVNNR